MRDSRCNGVSRLVSSCGVGSPGARATTAAAAAVEACATAAPAPTASSAAPAPAPGPAAAPPAAVEREVATPRARHLLLEHARVLNLLSPLRLSRRHAEAVFVQQGAVVPPVGLTALAVAAQVGFERKV